MNNDRRKLFGTILGIVIFIICVISISFAFYKWKSSDTDVNMSFEDVNFEFVMGSDVNATGLTPVLDYMNASNYTAENSGKYVAYTEFVANNGTSLNKYYIAKLNITTLDTELKTTSFKYSLLKKDTTSGEYDKLVCNGNFSAFTTGENTVCDGVEVKASTEDYYRFVVYIDGNEENDINMMSKSLVSTLVLSEDNDKNNIVTVSLNNNGATSSGTTSIYQRYGVGIYKDNTASTTEMTTSANNITTPTKTGYTFKGYYTKINSGGEQLINNNGYITDLFTVTKYKEATTLYAGYETNKYYISYSLNSGKFNNNDLKPSTAVYSDVVNISNPHRDGYKFIGWTSNDIDTGVAYYGDNDSSVTTKWSSTSTKVTANYFKNLTSTNEKTVTLNANFQDITKPECTIATPTDIISGNTTTVLLTCTDNDSLASNTLSASDFTISDDTIALVQSVSSATVVSSTEHQYTITIKGTSPGAYSISLNKGSVKDSIGNSNNKVTSEISNVTGTNIRDAEITVSPNLYTYDGTAKTPSVTVKFGNITLTKDTDYTISYSDNINIGTATVKVTGIGSYTGIVTKEFKIKKEIIDSMVTISPISYTYDATAKTPVATVTDGSITLKEDTDYTVSYLDNVNVGTATVRVTGKGSYTGTVDKTFTISYNAFEITLNSNIPSTITGGSDYYSNGTTTLYVRRFDGIYLDNGYTKEMTTSDNGITVPTATGYTFGGYYTGTSGSGTLMIDSSGKITSNFTNTKFSDATTLYAYWTRTFTCNSKNANTTYMGKEWYTLENSNNVCELVLNTTVGSSSGNAYSTSTGTESGSVYSYISDYSSKGTTLATENSAGLITTIDTNGGTTNNISGVYWVGDGTIYDSNTRYNHSCTATYLARGETYYNNTTTSAKVGTAMTYYRV